MFILPQFLELGDLQVSAIWFWGWPAEKGFLELLDGFHDCTGGFFLAQAESSW